MAELTFQEHVEDAGDPWVVEDYCGGHIDELSGLWMPAPGVQTDPEADPVDCFSALVNQHADVAKRLANVCKFRVYRSSGDADTEFSVSAGSVLYRGERFIYAGATAITGLVAGATRYIWAVMGTAPTVTIASGTAWPAATVPGILRLATIAQPASGAWGPTDMVAYVHEQAIVLPGANESLLEVDFAYNSASPLLIGTIAAGRRIKSAVIIISTAFNGAPSLTVGDAGDTDRLLVAANVVPTALGTYEVRWPHKYTSQTDVNLYITAGGASQGAGTVIID